jgi:predicted CxxxxCH...CXXCH cytochrome family protein
MLLGLAKCHSQGQPEILADYEIASPNWPAGAEKASFILRISCGK